jgi:predicted acyl esterase
VLANLMGFAVVDVNMRGTGRSGGAYDFFGPLQNLDGYDGIETIAHQSWVLGNRVGMLGISYAGSVSRSPRSFSLPTSQRSRRCR